MDGGPDPGGLPSRSCCSLQPRSVLATICRVLPKKNERKTEASSPSAWSPGHVRHEDAHTAVSAPCPRAPSGTFSPGRWPSCPWVLAFRPLTVCLGAWQTSQLGDGRAEAALDQRVPGARPTHGLCPQAPGWHRELGASGAPTPGGEDIGVPLGVYLFSGSLPPPGGRETLQKGGRQPAQGGASPSSLHRPLSCPCPVLRRGEHYLRS